MPAAILAAMARAESLRHDVSQHRWCMWAGDRTMCGLRIAAIVPDVPFNAKPRDGRLCEKCRAIAPAGIGEPAPFRAPDPPVWE